MQRPIGISRQNADRMVDKHPAPAELWLARRGISCTVFMRVCFGLVLGLAFLAVVVFKVVPLCEGRGGLVTLRAVLTACGFPLTLAAFFLLFEARRQGAGWRYIPLVALLCAPWFNLDFYCAAHGLGVGAMVSRIASSGPNSLVGVLFSGPLTAAVLLFMGLIDRSCQAKDRQLAGRGKSKTAD